MIEIVHNLYIGTQWDYEFQVKGKEGWHVVHACKEPYHRDALGYTGREAPKGHPEYLIAKRDNRLILNLIDPYDPRYIPKEVIDAALDFIEEGLSSGKKVLVHCMLGQSRSPSIGLLYMAINGHITNNTLEEAEKAFYSIYPAYFPHRGIRMFLRENWEEYCLK
jgi:hypothetical protein